MCSMYILSCLFSFDWKCVTHRRCVMSIYPELVLEGMVGDDVFRAT